MEVKHHGRYEAVARAGASKLGRVPVEDSDFWFGRGFDFVFCGWTHGPKLQFGQKYKPNNRGVQPKPQYRGQ